VYRLVTATACCFILAGLNRPAAAAEYCVVCAGPDATYRCVFEGSPEGAGTDPRAQLLCIKQLAEAGGHESCSVTRTAASPCSGELRVVAAPLGEPPLGEPPEPRPSEPAADAGVPPEAPAEGPPPESKPPRTVEELAGQTVESSKEGLKKAGETITGTAKKAGEQIGSAGSAVGNAAKKTWNCLTSLFSDC